MTHSPQSPGGSDSFIGRLGTSTLCPADYTSPSLTGWYGRSGVSRSPCLSFRATDAGACCRAEYDCWRVDEKKPLGLAPSETGNPFRSGQPLTGPELELTVLLLASHFQQCGDCNHTMSGCVKTLLKKLLVASLQARAADSNSSPTARQRGPCARLRSHQHGWGLSTAIHPGASCRSRPIPMRVDPGEPGKGNRCYAGSSICSGFLMLSTWMPLVPSS